MPSVGCWEAETNPTIPGVKELPVPSTGTRHQCCDTEKQRAVGTWGADPDGQGYVKPAWEPGWTSEGSDYEAAFQEKS